VAKKLDEKDVKPSRSLSVYLAPREVRVLDSLARDSGMGNRSRFLGALILATDRVGGLDGLEALTKQS